MNPGAFTESVVEEAALSWLAGLGYDVRSGPEIAHGAPCEERDSSGYRDVILARRLRLALVRLNPDLPTDALDVAFRTLSRPFAFTEQGVAMLSSVLRSPRAIQVNVEIMRAFVRLRRMLESNTEVARRLDELEQKYDEQSGIVFDAIRQLMAPPDPPRRRLGFPTGVPDDGV